MPIKREIEYPIFLQCSEHASDAYWESIFSDLAYGKTPYGTYISKGFLCCGYKKKSFSYRIDNGKTSKEIYNDIYELLTTKLGLLSGNDRVKKQQDISIMTSNMKNTYQNWSEIRKKNIKDLLVELFVSQKQKEYSLSFRQAKYLLSLIYVAIIFKVITSDDITFENGRISDIKGIDFVKNQVFFYKEIYSIETSFSPQIVIDKKCMSDNWEKYLAELKKVKTS